MSAKTVYAEESRAEIAKATVEQMFREPAVRPYFDAARNNLINGVADEADGEDAFTDQDVESVDGSVEDDMEDVMDHPQPNPDD